MKSLFLTLLMLTSIAVTAQKSVLLRVNYQKGDAYTVNLTTNSDMGVSGFMNMKMTMTMKVNAVEDGLFKTASQINSIVIAMEQGGMSMNYDTSMKPEELDAMGQQMKMQFDPMMAATIHTDIDKLGTSVDTRIEPTIAGLEQFAQNQGNLNYPSEEVSVGSSWTAEQEMQGMTTTLLYTVRSIADGTAILDISGDLKGIGTGTLKGQTIIDISTGVPTKSELQLTVSAQGTDVKTNVTTTMTKV